MRITLHCASFMMQEESLMRILKKQDVISTKSVKLLLQNITHVKAPGPINGKT